MKLTGRKLADLYQELQTVDTCPQLVTHFEGVLSSLVEDVRKLHEDNQKLEEMFNRERENHLHRLRGLEEELDAQVAKVEAQAQEEAKHKFDQEKRVLVKKMETEMLELKTHLKLFQKVNDILTGERKKTSEIDIQSSENQHLRVMLSDTKANLELVRAEMVKLRREYEMKCKELSSQQELLIQHINKSDHVQHQLRLLHEANATLQDTNDSLLSAMDISGIHTPRIPSPCCTTSSSVDSSDERKGKLLKCCRSDTNSYDLNIQADVSGTPFGIERLMEDFDSGRSTMKDIIDCDSETKSIKSLQEIASLNGKKFQNSSSFDDSCRSSPIVMDSLPHFSPTSSIILNRNTGYMEATGPPERTYKILFAGDAAVGKTYFIHRFCKGVFANRLGSTVGVDFRVKTIQVDEKNIALNLWDTAGQERFRSLTRSYFRRSDGVILLYDVTNEQSFLNIRQWIDSVEEISEKRIPIILCGNKVDIRQQAINEGKTCISKEQGEKLASINSALFLETSSKTGQNVTDAVIALTREMMTREDVEVKTSGMQITKIEKQAACCSRK
ncbi:ras and EF-hand domain-containing protein-like isoform X3 [Lycorma delicatula]|uniref:ras and EF-hand domain-containing protein-like isoform X3 n=1 Tax=Lycorma delicatula TaxID=130591 RepID=UPI003F519F1B